MVAQAAMVDGGSDSDPRSRLIPVSVEGRLTRVVWFRPTLHRRGLLVSHHTASPIWLLGIRLIIHVINLVFNV